MESVISLSYEVVYKMVQGLTIYFTEEKHFVRQNKYCQQKHNFKQKVETNYEK